MTKVYDAYDVTKHCTEKRLGHVVPRREKSIVKRSLAVDDEFPK